MTFKKPKIGVISTGGTLTALSRDPFEVCDYGEAGSLTAEELIARCATLSDRFDFVPIAFPASPSFDIELPHWLALCRLCEQATQENPGIEGFVLTHGTGSLEETAFFLSLVWDFPVPLVITGAQRPASALSSDGYMNFFQAACVASYQKLRQSGILVVAHNEVHLPADVTKTTTFGLDTFRSPDLGPIAQIIGGTVSLRRQAPMARIIPKADWRTLKVLPRVDILATHSGADDVFVEAAISAHAQGIVTAGFAPGYVTTAEAKRLARWIEEEGGIVIASTRAHGPVVRNTRNDGYGFIPAGIYSPPKARILLQIALASGLHKEQISSLFKL